MNRLKQNNLKNVSLVDKLQNVNSKTVAAVVLLSIMAILWGRVLLQGKDGPTSAAAQEVQQPVSVIASSEKSDTVVPVKLPVVEGQHDVLSGDMFSADNWKAFDLNDSTANVSTSQDNNLEQRHQANLEKIAGRLKLEAVIHNTDGKPYQVFVNDAILTVGSVLTVKEGPEEYELKLSRISENEAMFIWNETSITLKMTEMVEK